MNGNKAVTKVQAIIIIAIIVIAAIVTAWYLLIPPAEEKITIRVIGEALPPLEGISSLAEEIYEVENPNVDIIIEMYAMEEQLEKTVADLVAHTGKYDVIMTINFELGKYVENGWIYSFEDWLADLENIDPILAGEIDTNGIAELWDAACKYEGEYYGIPFNPHFMYQWYREDLFTHTDEMTAFEAEYGYPLAPAETWEQFRDISEFFTRDAGETLAGEVLSVPFYGTLLQAKRHLALAYELFNYFPAFGAEFWDENGNCVINSTEGQEALEFYVSLKEFSPPGTLEYTWDDALIMMQQNKIAQCIMWNDATFALFDPQMSQVVDKMGFALNPSKPPYEPSASFGAWSLCINKWSAHAEEAFKFIAWTAQADIQLEWALRGGEPWTHSPYQDPLITDTWRDYLLVNYESGSYAFETIGSHGAVGAVTKEPWSS